MTPRHAVLLSALLLATVHAQRIDIRGMVLDRYTSLPVPGARVALVEAGLSATTDSSGAFHLERIPTGTSALPRGSSLVLRPTGTGVGFRASGGPVTVRMVDLLGKPLGPALRAVLPSGEWEFRPPAGARGISVVQVAVGRERASIKWAGLGSGQEGHRWGGSAFRAVSPGLPLAKSGAAADTLRVTRAGYLRTTLPLDSMALAGLSVHLVDSTASQARLRGLGLSSGSLEPGFDPGFGFYEVYLREATSSLRITPSAGTAKPSIRIQGKVVGSGQASDAIPLNLFENEIQVEVRSQDSTAHVAYFLKVFRADDDSAGIVAVGSSAGTFTERLQPGGNTMTLEVPESIPSVTITPYAIQPLCAVTVDGKPVQRGGASEPLTIPAGSREVPIEVTSPDGSRRKTFSLTLKRGTGPLPVSGLEITPGEYFFPLRPAFHPDSMGYYVMVGHNDSLLGVTLHSSDPSCTLRAGSRTDSSMVVASGQSRTYRIPVGVTLILFSAEGCGQIPRKLYSLYVSRPELLATPVIRGPAYGYAGDTITFTFSNTNECFTRKARTLFDWGDGLTSYSHRHVYSSPGTYAVKARLYCEDPPEEDRSKPGMSLWSAPRTLVIHPADTHPERRISGPRSASETWSAETTYVVTENTLFEEGTTLTIRPGVRVRFEPGRYLLLHGRIHAVGTATDSIRFEEGLVKVPWRGPAAAESAGNYLAGPRFEFCTFRNSHLHTQDDNTAFGGYGPYIKDSYVHTLGPGSFANGAGAYIERCRIGSIQTLHLSRARILRSHIGSASVSAGPGTLRIRGSEIGSLTLESGTFAPGDVAGNTLLELGINSPTGTVQGNNILGKSSYAVIARKSPFGLQGNWWGETVTAEMAAKGAAGNITAIRDYMDDIELARIDFSGWRTEPVADALPGW